MLSFKLIAICSIMSGALGLISEPKIHRQYSDNVKAEGYRVIYGDEDITMLNQVVQEYEKSDLLKRKVDVNTSIQPLPATDVKCLMSVDSYCSRDMLVIKGILIQALKENCEKCSSKQKEQAGRVITSMMAYDPAAWKLFLTRSALQLMPPKSRIHLEDQNRKMRVIGKPEIVENERNRYTAPGVHVRLSDDFSITALITNLFIVAVIMTQLVLYMWNAGDITYQATLISDAIFYCGWERRVARAPADLDLRRIVFMGIAQSQKPLIFKAFGIQEMSYRSFVSVLRATYSIFAVMHNTKNE